MQSLRTVLPEPAVSRRSLITGGGVAWSVGGGILLWRAFHVGADLPLSYAWLWGIGVVLGILKYRFVFRRVAAENVRRIRELSPHKDKICLFAFQSLQAYLLVLVMVPLGIALRHLGLAPSVLVVVYVLIATALILGAVKYFREAAALK